MEDVKKEIGQFLKDEAALYEAYVVPDLERYQEAYNRLNAHMVQLMLGTVGLPWKNKLEAPDFYESYPSGVEYKPRILYKLSHYKHPVYQDVWVAYVSTVNPQEYYHGIFSAFLIVKEAGAYKIAREYMYSDYGSDGRYYEWEGNAGGYQDLLLEELGDPVEVERYTPPNDGGITTAIYEANT